MAKTDYGKIVNEEEERLRRLVREVDADLPDHARQAVRLTRDEESHDYQTAKGTPGGYEQRIQEGKVQFGTVKAVFDFADWVLRNE